MSTKRMLVLLGVMVLSAVLFAACAGPAGPAGAQGPAGPAGPSGPAGPAGADAQPAEAVDLSCAECHNDSHVIAGKENAWASSVHGSSAVLFPGTTVSEYTGGQPVCSACHSGNGFSYRIAEGLKVTEVQDVDPNISHIDCRACHQIHTTYTEDDWALETDAPVKYEAINATYDGGTGNLCASCHQPYTPFPEAKDGKVTVPSTHWGGHHGPQAALVQGVGGQGGVEDKTGVHYSKVKDTCTACHMDGDQAVHTFEPSVAVCQSCHTETKNFDVNGGQTKIKEKLEQVKQALIAKGLMDKDGTIIVGDYPEAQAAALWNYLLVEEDRSAGAHNPGYANALLDYALDALK